MQINIKAVITGTIVAALLAPLAFSVQQVPVTMQTFVLFTLAAVLGKNSGFFIALAYVILGGIGLPIFGDHTGGYEKLIGPTAGFIWAFPVICYYIGWECQRTQQNFFFYILAFVKAHVLLLIPGFLVLYLMVDGVLLWDTLIRLTPGLLLKSIAGGLLAIWLIKKLPPTWTEASSSLR